ncbi:RDD family protein [Rivularia sp. UHCC 0363]|uniref:RDD family protein n=1 Tax=Rivularia sp. UHCC 0363 TaxID=3110244 RepID=UPI003A59880F
MLFLFLPDMSAIAKASIIINLILNWFYFTVLESSQLKATLGKFLLGIKVTDSNNQKISFMQANIRYWSKFISILTLAIGFITILFTPKKQGCHDMLVKTTVIKK